MLPYSRLHPRAAAKFDTGNPCVPEKEPPANLGSKPRLTNRVGQSSGRWTKTQHLRLIDGYKHRRNYEFRPIDAMIALGTSPTERPILIETRIY